ncbi:RRM domain-containing protein [Meloidogyne graminicola]|uniref:RRM domain-containing protein n=1 Tax=Meloidogyne graminicola TaxID=189291 RepID=A0A8S9ZF52_9BILA|nr:RRM domain-containing protein [Meloidogyne graminicola]
MISTFHHHQQVAAMAAAAANAAHLPQNKEENGNTINISINENGRNDKINGTGGLELNNNNINEYSHYGDSTKFTTINNNNNNSSNNDCSNGGNRLVQTMNGTISQSYQDLSSCVQYQPNSILRIIIECMLYPVTLDVLYMIFSRYGKVLRIITFNKNNSFQALIQLSESNAAMNAKNSLDGLNIYNGCCTLNIEFSKLNTLNVKYNNDKSRDYTNPNLPSGELTYEQKLQLILQNAQLTDLLTAAAAGGGQLLSNNLNGIVLNTSFQSNTTAVVLVSNLDETVSVYGDVIRVKILFNKKDNALIQYSDIQQAQLGQPDAGLTKEFISSSLHRFKKPGSKNYMNIYPPCSTLHLSNIPNGMDEHQLLEIFKEFKITEFKFFQKDHKMALVQLEDIENAVSFLIAMHNHKLAENAHLRVSFSKKGMN